MGFERHDLVMSSHPSYPQWRSFANGFQLLREAIRRDDLLGKIGVERHDPRLPGWWRWYYWANPIAWSLYGLLTSQYGDLDEPMKLWDGVHSVSIRKFLRDYFEYRHDFLGIAGIMVVSFCVLFAFIYAFAIKSFNFQRR